MGAARPIPLARRSAAALAERWLLPALLVLAALACSPELGDSFELPKLAVLKLGLAVALLALLLGARLAGDVARGAAGLVVGAYLAVNGAATLAAVEPRSALLGSYGHDQGLLTLLVGAAFFLLAASWIHDEAALARLAAALAAVASAQALYALAQHLGLDPLGWPAQFDGRRTSGTIGHPNALGEFFALALPLGGWLVLRQRGLRRDLLLWSLGLQLVALALTQARAAWGVVALQALLAALLRLRAAHRFTRLLLLVPQATALALFAALLLAPPLATQADAAVSGIVPRGEPLLARALLWRSALALVAERPWLGWGPDSFALVYPRHRVAELDALEAAVGQDDAVHNTLLRVATSSGLLGLGAYLAVQAALLARVLPTLDPPAPPGRRMALLALLLSWGSYTPLFATGESRILTEWLFWLLGGAALGLALGARCPRTPSGVWDVPKPPTPGRRRGLARAAAALLGALLALEALSALAADAAFGQSVLHRADATGDVVVTWAEWAATLRPFEPVYQRELGLALADRARQTGDRAGLAAALARLATASSLQGGRNVETLLDLARARLEWDLVEAQPSAVPLEFAQRALALDPANPLLYADAADLALRQGRLDEGRQYWEAARSRARSPDALLRVGEVGLRLGEPLAARMALREAARREWRRPLQAEVYRVWGAAALAAGLPEEAAQAYGEALRRDPGDVEARVQRAQALAEAGRREEASREARAALRLAPDNPQAAALLVRLSAP